MPEESTAVATPESAPTTTESTIAPAPTSTYGKDGTLDIESLSPSSQEYRDWQLGKLPAGKKTSVKSSPKKETPASAESAPATETEDLAEDEDSPSSAAETAAESQPAPAQRGKKGEKRYHELVDIIRQKDAEILQLRTPVKPETAAPKAESQPAGDKNAAAQEPALDGIDPETGKPFTVGGYMKAHDKWLENSLLSKAEKQAEQKQRERMSQQQTQEITDRFRNRVEKAREKYSDYNEAVLAVDPYAKENTPLAGALVLSEHGPEMIYLLAKNPGEAERISKLAPFDQAREMFLLELLAGGFDSLVKDKRFEPKLSASLKTKKTITAAPQPAHEVGGAGQVLPDEVEQAAKESEDDPQATRRFIDAANRKRIARLKGK